MRLSNLQVKSNAMPKILVVFSVPRTGTNHLFRLLDNISDLKVYYEIFHPHAAYGLEKFYGDLEAYCVYEDVYRHSIFEKELINKMHAAPGRFLDFAISRYNNHSIVFKIFPGHLSIEKIKEELLLRDEVAALIIQRRPIDTYISSLKARKTGKYINVNTSDIKVNLNAEEYMHWWQMNFLWYRDIFSLVGENGLPYTSLIYEKDIVGDVDIVTENAIKKINGLGFSLRIPERLRNQGLLKQDMQADFVEKIHNWQNFFMKVNKNGNLNTLYDYFLEL
jgi:hypothetical protein